LVLQLACVLLFLGTILLFWLHNKLLLSLAYVCVGVATGLGMSTVNALAAEFTIKGMRYKVLAKMAMVMDVMRIGYPFLSGLIYVATGIRGLIFFALFTVCIFVLFTIFYKLRFNAGELVIKQKAEKALQAPIKHNRPFFFMILLEFLDSFASSQLFVFLPALLVFKHYSIENALIMQSVVFSGYLCGRWLVGVLANRFTGLIAVGLAEIGMIVAIIFLVFLPASHFIYLICFFLGLFTRGTSPVLKALIFDQLEPHQIPKGTAIYGVSGDTGGAIAQLLFGFMLAWFGVTAPFVLASIAAGLVVIGCFFYNGNVNKL
jgi:MFS family permease